MLHGFIGRGTLRNYTSGLKKFIEFLSKTNSVPVAQPRDFLGHKIQASQPRDFLDHEIHSTLRENPSRQTNRLVHADSEFHKLVVSPEERAATYVEFLKNRENPPLGDVHRSQSKQPTVERALGRPPNLANLLLTMLKPSYGPVL